MHNAKYNNDPKNNYNERNVDEFIFFMPMYELIFGNSGCIHL